MNQILFKAAESAVSPSQILINLIISLIASIILGILLGRIRNSFKDSFLTFLIAEIIIVILYFTVKDKVQTERLKRVKDTMISIDENSFVCSKHPVNIKNWEVGLECIKSCPTEIGYYITTVDYLEKENDYESAATLIEMGLDFIRISPPPAPLCERLRLYYSKLSNRPALDYNCNKFHY